MVEAGANSIVFTAAAKTVVGLQMRILCVHQGYELYGSDRCFAESVAAIRKAYPEAEIEVVLSRAGPIVGLLEANASHIVYEPIWVLRRRNLVRLATIDLLRLPKAIVKAAARMRRSDLVYINTCVVADYILAARFFKRSALVHVHEIPEGLALRVLRTILSWSRAQIIFNSKATQAAFKLPQTFRCSVIYNGVSGPVAAEPSDYDGNRRLRLLMLGRINRIKGQEILVEAIGSLPQHVRSRMAVRIVGGAFEDRSRETMLQSLVDDAGLSDVIKIEPFTTDPTGLYHWADVVVIPSHKPESLGRVAIEAMAFARPPIASEIGGLVEVVEDGRTGWLVAPGRADLLADTIQAIIEHPESIGELGRRARERYEVLFSGQSASDAIIATLQAKLSGMTKRGPNADRRPTLPDMI
jgi:glycosyltransferase involved in cell wall biosynthesis